MKIQLESFNKKWEGPYLITRTNKLGSFHLENMNVEEINHTWNIKALRRYYPLVSKIYFRSTLVLSLYKFQFKCKMSCTLFPLRGRPSQGEWFFNEAVSIVNSSNINEILPLSLEHSKNNKPKSILKIYSNVGYNKLN
jgi:hypothetical protein